MTTWRIIITSLCCPKSFITAIKKTIHASERDRPDVQARRKLWKEQQSGIDVSRLVFLNESGVNTDMTRRYARAKNGQRANDHTPLNTGKITTTVSSVRTDGTTVPMFLSGSLNGETFKDYIEQHLAPTLHEGDIVVMDNLHCHKVKGIEQAIEKVGAHILYLPPYSLT